MRIQTANSSLAKQRSNSFWGIWTVLGAVLGIAVGMTIHSMTIGLIAGLCVGMVLGRASQRVVRGSAKLRVRSTK